MRLNWIRLSLFIALFISSCEEKSRLYSEFVGQGEDQIEVVVVKGTPYEMGYQLGQHLKDKAQATLQNYLNKAFNTDSTLLSPKALLQAWHTNEPFMDHRFLEEMQGFSEGSGIDLKILQEAHAVPFIAPYACSGVDIWGEASVTGDLFHIRNLDYEMDAGLQDYPIVVIYKPIDGFAHANITFSGVLSSHTGINSQSIVLGEKGESPAKEIPYDLHGKHFTILFREILYDAQSLSDVENLIEKSPLIKRYYLFVGDGKLKEHAAIKYLISTPDTIKFHKWTDMDSTDVYVPKVFKDVTYYTMKNDDAARFIDDHHGQIGSQEMVQLSKLIAASGRNLVNVVYNASTKEIWLAYAGKHERAADRNFVYIDLKKYL